MVLCTKLMQWLCGGGLVLVLWSVLIFDLLPLQLSPQLYDVTLPFPVYLVVCYGCYSLAVIGCRLITFNDCEDASVQLRKEISEARKDLEEKGFKF